MADIQFYEADSDESSDSGDNGLLTTSEGYDSDTNNSDYGLSPLQKLEKHILSEHSYTRQVVAKNLLETLKTVDNPADVEKVLQAIIKLASDLDSAVRTEVMEQVYAISLYIHEMQFDQSFISLYIVPPLVKCLQDCNAQVRKTSQSSMLAITQDGIVSHADVEAVVIPVLLDLVEPDGLDDFRAEAIVMMTKLAPLLGAEVTTRSFLDKFLYMCGDALFHVRKVCATNFGEICRVVGSDLTEAKLLPKFANLCEDDVWGVRNACTECFMQVSRACSMAVRRGELSRLFIGLLSDQSRWVRLAAFQSLGAFISTFADPLYTGLSLSEDGKVIHHPRIEEDRVVVTEENMENAAREEMCLKGRECSAAVEINSKSSLQASGPIAEITNEDFVPEYTSFNYWRTPLAEVVPDADGASSKKSKSEETTEDVKCSEKDGDSLNDVEDSVLCCDSTCHENPDKSELENQNKNLRDHERNETSHIKDVHLEVEEHLQTSKNEALIDCDDQECLELYTEDSQQFAIPPELLHHYLSMVDTNNSQTVDAEIMKHCAFSFPAVTFALGRRNWYLLKSAYERLARDLQWKVRRTLSSSIHEMAVILGEELTMSDLLPIFDDFFKDLDEVRIGILKHLTDFLRLLRHDIRRQYLPKIADFLTTDNSRNWRFRLDLTEQLIDLLDLYSPTDVVEHLTSVALILADDKVAQVRYMSIHVLSKIIGKLSLDVCAQLWADFVECIKTRLYQSTNYGRRQLFAHLCSNLMEIRCLSLDCFTETFLPCLITLSQDRVPNVRLAVAKCVFRHLVHDDYFLKPRNHLREPFLQMIENLKKDSDADVKKMLTSYAPHLQPEFEPTVISRAPELSEILPASYLNEFISKCDERPDLNIQTISVHETDNMILTMEH